MAYYSAGAYRARNSIGYLVRRASNLLMSRVETAFAEHEVTFVQWQVLMYLRDGMALTAAEICRDLCHDSGALTRVVDQLEQRGFIERRRTSQDRRVVTLFLTDKGRQAVESLIPAVVDCLNGAVVGLSHTEIDSLIGLMRKLVNGLSSRDNAPPVGCAELESPA